ncbi:MAG TPA: hypothetical protein VKA55_05370, partial [Gammaproteobacteria bacterium]|nr:hypothetical protein [Gammaproteobacteria bacterium]
EIVRGIRSVRVDVRAVITAAGGCPETLRPLLQEYRGTAAAPAIIDHQRAGRRAAERLGPSALLAVHRLPPPRFLRGVAGADVPVTAVSCEPPARLPRGLRFDHILPVGEAQAERWRTRGFAPEAPVDLELFLARTDVEPTFKAAIAPGEGRRLLWADRLPRDAQRRNAFVERWCGEDTILVVGGAGPGGGHNRPVVRLSEWDRERRPLEPGTLVWMDEERWLPAVSASAFAGVLVDPSRTALWQALASGLPTVATGSAPATLRDLGVDPEAATALAADWDGVDECWAHWRQQAFAWRDQQARTRRAFWEVRRRAEAAMALLDRWADAW